MTSNVLVLWSIKHVANHLKTVSLCRPLGAEEQRCL